jgi:hypothetical protein
MKKTPLPEFDFALVIDGVPELSEAVEAALFEAGCDDATFSIRYGRLYAEFSRPAKSLQDAILRAIRDIRQADVGAVVMRVDESDLVTPSEIARRIKRSRQMVHQYINGVRGPGNFPPPECHITDRAPLWAWSAVSDWLAKNGLIRPEESWNAVVVAAINTSLDASRQREQHPGLFAEIQSAVRSA